MSLMGTWCCGITPAQHAGGPGLNPQRVHFTRFFTARKLSHAAFATLSCGAFCGARVVLLDVCVSCAARLTRCFLAHASYGGVFAVLFNLTRATRTCVKCVCGALGALGLRLLRDIRPPVSRIVSGMKHILLTS